MSLRKSTAGRPSGTDGSDFSYRMVIDPRYLKVAEGKSRLSKLLVAQAIYQVLGVGWLFLFKSQKMGPDSLTILSIVIGFISLLIGELGRHRSQVTLLRLYSTVSSMATALSVACVIRSDFFLQVIQDWSVSAIKIHDWVDISCAAIGILLQIVVIVTTTSLVYNMSPRRAASQ
ncbi:unnamed protein product [Spirodela intermedia]|uniref:Uncharacterized protein n=2 Tax=Spirodela intermedia TaxID=51605 RepID=A0A7I8L7K8_SPIIN|nr:unnamed protein product [Spirodela intermedia]CAA6668721.1 unnamed protein product [Spirodela intermedia]CAA7405616.1 unnamed protein product [Spirodela intermedia]